MTETELKNQLCTWLERFPDRCVFTISPPRRGKYTSRFLRAGWPDISGSWNGRPLGIEVKLPSGALSIAQHEMIERMRKLGWIAFVATCPEDCHRELLGTEIHENGLKF